MLMTKQRRPAIQTLRGWAISVLQEAGASAPFGSNPAIGLVVHCG
jgi:hypothetical protein